MAKAAQRASLGSFAQVMPQAEVNGAKVEQGTTPVEAKKYNYHKVNVYLSAEEVRTLKLICVDSGQRLSDIGAKAIREWMERNGHSRKFSA